jgi:hypothetical protein
MCSRLQIHDVAPQLRPLMVDVVKILIIIGSVSFEVKSVFLVDFAASHYDILLAQPMILAPSSIGTIAQCLTLF